jgi:hypothetical protein
MSQSHPSGAKPGGIFVCLAEWALRAASPLVGLFLEAKSQKLLKMAGIQSARCWLGRGKKLKDESRVWISWSTVEIPKRRMGAACILDSQCTPGLSRLLLAPAL